MRAMPGSVSAFARVVGTAGQMMRGLVFTAVGTYILIAAIRDAPGQTKGLDMTLRALDAKPYGSWQLILAGAGFLAFALFSLVEVPYGRT